MPSPLRFVPGLTLSAQVSDLDRSMAWYRDVLGFEILYKVDEMGWGEVKTEVPGVNIGFAQVESPRVGAGPVPTFGVESVDDARAQLEAKGVRFDGETREYPGMVRLATFFDPDGNALMLYQSLSDDA
jgi:predicted enzyme related to lactoylglutathione lyase